MALHQRQSRQDATTELLTAWTESLLCQHAFNRTCDVGVSTYPAPLAKLKRGIVESAYMHDGRFTILLWSNAITVLPSIESLNTLMKKQYDSLSSKLKKNPGCIIQSGKMLDTKKVKNNQLADQLKALFQMEFGPAPKKEERIDFTGLAFAPLDKCRRNGPLGVAGLFEFFERDFDNNYATATYEDLVAQCTKLDITIHEGFVPADRLMHVNKGIQLTDLRGFSQDASVMKFKTIGILDNKDGTFTITSVYGVPFINHKPFAIKVKEEAA